MKLPAFKKDKKIILGISVMLGLIMYFLYILNVFGFWDWKLIDFFFNIRPSMKTDPAIVIIAIDDESIREFGKFPWETKIHANLINRIAPQKPKLIAFDVLFDKADTKNPDNDKLFAEAIRNAGNVILAMGFTAQSRPTDYFKRETSLMLDMAQASMPIHTLRDVALDMGVVNIFPEKDAINRKVYLSIPFGDQVYLTLASAIAKHALDVPTDQIKIMPRDFYYGPKHHANLDPDGRAIINYYGASSDPGYFTIMPYTEVYNNKMPPDYFKDKIILIGGTAAGLGDLWATPLAHAAPGVEIQATILNNILGNQFLKRTPAVYAFLTIFLLTLMMGLTTALFSPFKNAAFTMVLIVGLVVYYYMQFTYSKTVSPAATILITVVFCFIIDNIFKLVFEEKEKQEISVEKEKYYEMATVDGLTQLYVARYFRQRLKEEMVKAQQNNVTLSFVMVDIDNFKKVNDVYGHEQGNIVLRETAQIVKTTLRSASDIPARYGGEEIAIILPNTDSATGFQIANRIRERMATHTYSGFKGFKQITASFGVANYPEHAKDETEIVERADEALYESKKTGKNKVTMAHAKVEGEAGARAAEAPAGEEQPKEEPPKEEHGGGEHKEEPPAH